MASSNWDAICLSGWSQHQRGRVTGEGLEITLRQFGHRSRPTRSVRVDAQVDGRALRRVLGALDGSMITPPPACGSIWPAATRTCARVWRRWRCWCSRAGRGSISGAVYAFRGRRAGLIKLLWHDGIGLCMLTKRLEQGQFVWPCRQRDRCRCTAGSCLRCSTAASGGRRRATCGPNWRADKPGVITLDIGSDATASSSSSGVQIDLAALPDDPAVLQQMLREVVPELHAENDKLRLLIQRLLRHRFGRRSEQLDLDQLQFGLEDLEQSGAESRGRRRCGRAAGAAAHRGGQPESRCVAGSPAALRGGDRHRDQACPCCGGALHVIGETAPSSSTSCRRSCGCG